MKTQAVLFNHLKLILFLLIFCFTNNVNVFSQSIIQIGSGNSVRGESGGAPYATYFEDQKLQILITKAELNTLNVSSGFITSLAFKTHTIGMPFINGFTIKIGSTTQSSLSGYASLVGGFTTCYSASYILLSGGWNTYKFTTPFYWDNSNNIVIEVCYDNSEKGYSTTTFYTTTSVNTVYGTYQDTSVGCASGSLAYVNAANKHRPNMQLGYTPTSIYTNDIGVYSVDVPEHFCTNYQNINVTVNNYGKNVINNYYINWSINGVLQTPIYSTLPLDTVGGSGLSARQITLGSYTFPFYSISTIKAWTSLPNNASDSEIDNDSCTITRLPSLAGGTYTVGTNTSTFNTLDDAVYALTTNGICGPVRFIIAPGTYTRTQPLNLFGFIKGASEINTITFDGQDANACKITGNLNIGLLNFHDARFITFRNVTVENTRRDRPGIGYSSAISISGKSNKISLIKVNAIKPIPNPTDSGGFCINVSGSVGGTDGFTGGYYRNIVIDSCRTLGADAGVFFYGINNKDYNQGLVVSNTQVDSAHTYGIYVYKNYNPVKINYNTVNMKAILGIYFSHNLSSHLTKSHEIIGNRVFNFAYIGIFCNYPSIIASTAPVKIYNNIVASKYKNLTYAFCGISIKNNYPGALSYSDVEVFHNTVVMNGPDTAGYTKCLEYIGAPNCFIKNNLFTLKSGGSNTVSISSNSPAGNINYNNYYNTSFPIANILVRDGNNYTLSNYQTALAGGVNSSSIETNFEDNYKPNSGCLKGVSTNGSVNIDIDGNSRSLTEPNLGAYEHQYLTRELLLKSISLTTPQVYAGLQDLVVVVKNVGTSTITSFNVAYTLNNGTPVVTNWSGSLPPCMEDTIVFTGSKQVNLGNSPNSIKAYTYLPNNSTDLNLTNDTLIKVFYPWLNGTYVIGAPPSDYLNFGDAIADMQARGGVAGPVVFTVKTGQYNEQILLNNVAGANPTNTITFKSVANHVDSVNLTNSGNNVVKFSDSANYYIFDKLTISQTNDSVSGTTLFINYNCSYDTFINCKITANIYNVNGVTAKHYLVNATSNKGTGLAFINNNLNGGYDGLYITGMSRAIPHRNTYIVNNTLSNIHNYQIYGDYSMRMQIENNQITLQPVGAATNSFINCYYADTGFRFVNNTWKGNNFTKIYIYLGKSKNSPNERSLIANNKILGLPAAYFYVGNSTTEYQDVVHNTFFTGTGYFYVTSNLVGNFRVKNNIICGTGSYSYFIPINPNSPTFESDYNLIYTSGSSTPFHYYGLPRTFAFYRDSFPDLEKNSLTYPATYTSITNLAPKTSDSVVWAINGRGTHLDVATIDANNVARPTTPAQGAPDIGAYEITPTSTPPLAVASPAVPVQGGTQVFTFGEDTVATIQYDLYQPVPTSVNIRQYTGVVHPHISPTQNHTNVYNQTSATGSGTFKYTYNMYYKNPQIGNNPTKANMVSAAYRNNTWTIYGSGTSTIDTIRNRITTPLMSEFGDYIGTDKFNPLPIVLTAFDAKANGKNVLLTWATSSEKNASHFELQVSVDGKNFKPIAKVKATGNTNSTKEYNYNHFDAFELANTLYYRLKSVDVDGESAISKVVIVTLNKAAIEDVVVYPNPFTSELTIALPNNEQAQVEIVSLEGVQVLSSKVTADANGMVKMEGLNNLSAGVYFVRITQNGQTTVSKLVKQ